MWCVVCGVWCVVCVVCVVCVCCVCVCCVCCVYGVSYAMCVVYRALCLVAGSAVAGPAVAGSALDGSAAAGSAVARSAVAETAGSESTLPADCKQAPQASNNTPGSPQDPTHPQLMHPLPLAPAKRTLTVPTPPKRLDRTGHASLYD